MNGFGPLLILIWGKTNRDRRGRPLLCGEVPAASELKGNGPCWMIVLERR